MYWKKFVISFLFFLVIFSREASAEEYEAYPGISEISMEVLNNVRIPIDKDYVLFRSSSTDIVLVVGDINVQDDEGTTFRSSSTCDVYTLCDDDTFKHSTIDELSLKVNDMVVYSNLGEFPEMYERSDIYEATTLFVLCVGFCFSLVLLIFKGIRR